MPVLLRLLFMPRAAAALYGIFVNVSVLAAFDGVLPLFVKEEFGWDSFAAGLLFFCLVLPTLGGPLVGWLCDRWGPRWITVAGCALTAPPVMAMQYVTGDSIEQKVLLCTLLTICGMLPSLSRPSHHFPLRLWSIRAARLMRLVIVRDDRLHTHSNCRARRGRPE